MPQLRTDGNMLWTLFLTQSALNAVGCFFRITQQALIPVLRCRIVQHVMIIAELKIAGDVDPFGAGHAIVATCAIDPL